MWLSPQIKGIKGKISFPVCGWEPIRVFFEINQEERKQTVAVK